MYSQFDASMILGGPFSCDLVATAYFWIIQLSYKKKVSKKFCAKKLKTWESISDNKPYCCIVVVAFIFRMTDCVLWFRSNYIYLNGIGMINTHQKLAYTKK